MHSQPRYFVISAPSFDGVTPLDPGLLEPKGENPGGGTYPRPSQNEPRIAATLLEPVGRFSIRSLLRDGRIAAVIRVRCITPAAGSWQLRSAAAGEQIDPPPIDQPLEPVRPLTQEWSLPVVAGTTDALVVTYGTESPFNPQIEIEVSEFSGELVVAVLAAKAKQCCPPIVPEDPLWITDGSTVSNTKIDQALLMSIENGEPITAISQRGAGFTSLLLDSRIVTGYFAELQATSLGFRAAVGCFGDGPVPENRGTLWLQSLGGRLEQDSIDGVFLRSGLRNAVTLEPAKSHGRLSDVSVQIPSGVLTDVVEIEIDDDHLYVIKLDMDLYASNYLGVAMTGRWSTTVCIRRVAGVINILGSLPALPPTTGGFNNPVYDIVPTANSIRVQIAVDGDCDGAVQVDYSFTRKPV